MCCIVNFDFNQPAALLHNPKNPHLLKMTDVSLNAEAETQTPAEKAKLRPRCESHRNNQDGTWIHLTSLIYFTINYVYSELSVTTDIRDLLLAVDPEDMERDCLLFLEHCNVLWNHPLGRQYPLWRHWKCTAGEWKSYKERISVLKWLLSKSISINRNWSNHETRPDGEVRVDDPQRILPMSSQTIALWFLFLSSFFQYII